MKKIFKPLICAILFIVMALSMTACANKPSYEVTAVAKSSGSFWSKPATSYVIYTQEQLQQMLDELDAELGNKHNTEEWSLRTDDGTEITKEFFNESSLYFDSKALVVSVFYSPCLGATVTRHDLWKSTDTLHVEIDFTYNMLTAIETVMVIMKVDRNFVEDVTNVELALNDKQFI